MFPAMPTTCFSRQYGDSTSLSFFLPSPRHHFLKRRQPFPSCTVYGSSPGKVRLFSPEIRLSWPILPKLLFCVYRVTRVLDVGDISTLSFSPNVLNYVHSLVIPRFLVPQKTLQVYCD
jgi:hypothetical protein